MNWKLGLVAVSLALLLIACGGQEMPEVADEPAAPTTPVVRPPAIQPPAPAADATADAVVSDIEIEVIAIDELEAELDMSDLDALDQELAALDSLDFD